MAAGTPVVVSDADSMAELWSDAAIVLPRPINLSEWYLAVDELLNNMVLWKKHSLRGRHLAKQYDWRAVARRYLDVACA
jgi:glycosyltransferase involved in cell wall biosynthesis